MLCCSFRGELRRNAGTIRVKKDASCVVYVKLAAVAATGYEKQDGQIFGRVLCLRKLNEQGKV